MRSASTLAVLHILRVQGHKQGNHQWGGVQTGAAAGPAPQTVRESSQRLGTKLDYDVVMCGGSLGVFLACLLQLNGFRWTRLADLPHLHMRIVYVITKPSLVGQVWTLLQQNVVLAFIHQLNGFQ